MYNNKYKQIECDVCGDVFEEATNCLIFEEPKHNGKRGKTFHICDPETQADWKHEDLCISHAFTDKILNDFKRYNFRRIFLIAPD